MYEVKEGTLDRIEQWPRDGWLEKSLEDLADSIETVVLSEWRILKGVRILEETVRQAAEYIQARTPEHLAKLPILGVSVHLSASRSAF